MRALIAVGLIVAASLSGCTKKEETTVTTMAGKGGKEGRYLGLGIYSPGELWEKQVVTKPAADPAAATLADDDEIIVVADSKTGEIRQCGNLSGHCIKQNPWMKTSDAVPTAPTSLTVHAADLRRAKEAAAAEEAGRSR